MIPIEEWKWLPHPQHLCVAHECQFRLGTIVGNVVVSTVGEYRLPEKVKKELIVAGSQRAKSKDWYEIGCDRKYETMVFPVDGGKRECEVCPNIKIEEMDMEGYNDAHAALKGHMATCYKWAQDAKQDLAVEVLNETT